MRRRNRNGMRTYDRIKAAVEAKRSIRVVFKGRARDVSPHIIGRKNGQETVLAYQFSGYSSSGLPPRGEWRCIPVADITEVSDLDEPWRSADNYPGPQTCVDEVDVEA